MFFDRIGSANWRIRRRIVILTLLYCAIVVGYLAIWGRPVTLSETIASGLIFLAASVIGSYVFGVVWDDKRLDPAGGGRAPRADPAAPEGGEPPRSFPQDD